MQHSQFLLWQLYPKKLRHTVRLQRRSKEIPRGLRSPWCLGLCATVLATSTWIFAVHQHLQRTSTHEGVGWVYYVSCLVTLSFPYLNITMRDALRIVLLHSHATLRVIKLVPHLLSRKPYAVRANVALNGKPAWERLSAWAACTKWSTIYGLTLSLRRSRDYKKKKLGKRKRKYHATMRSAR